MTPRTFCLAVRLLAVAVAFAAPQTVDLNQLDGLTLLGLKAETVEYRGRHALRLTETGASDEPAIAVIRRLHFRDGTIEVELAGAPSASAFAAARGFVGIAFRVDDAAKKFECIYLRPTNGRANDQVRRNHSVQYSSHPDYPWQRLRKEEPEKYETYVDLEPGVWTKVRIVVSGNTARLYVHGAVQPTLVVNDLKLGTSEGAVALWVGPGTVAHFTNLTIDPAE